MNQRQVVLILICTGAIALLLLFPAPVWYIRGALMGRTSENYDYQAVKVENTVLKSEIAALENESRQRILPGSVSVFVYSRYPFNIKNQIVVNAGTNEGIHPGMAVAVPTVSSSEGVLAGKVTEAGSETSIVQTVFDPDFKLAVKVGDHGIDALYSGGNDPKLTLIPKNVKLNPGDVVYNASPDFPYGIPLGNILEVKLSPDSLFQEALISVPYDINGLQMVAVLKK